MYQSPGVLAIFLVIFVVAAPTKSNGLNNPRKLQESSVSGDPNGEIKCGSCPACNTPCNQSPPSLPPPPPTPKKPSTPSLNCPPPPSYLYITGPPGNLYPVDPYFSGARSLLARLPIIVGCGFLSFLTLNSMAL